MGYSIFQRAAWIRIDGTHAAEALAALKALHGREPINDSTGAHFSFVQTETYLAADTLGKALAEWRWDPGDLAVDGSVVDLRFTGQSLGDEDILFATLAPFVSPGSFVEMIGEDGAVWRWAFQDRSVYRLATTVTFPAPIDAFRLDLADLPGRVRFRSTRPGG